MLRMWRDSMSACSIRLRRRPERQRKFAVDDSCRLRAHLLVRAAEVAALSHDAATRLGNHGRLGGGFADRGGRERRGGRRSGGEEGDGGNRKQKDQDLAHG